MIIFDEHLMMRAFVQPSTGLIVPITPQVEDLMWAFVDKDGGFPEKHPEIETQDWRWTGWKRKSHENCGWNHGDLEYPRYGLPGNVKVSVHKFFYELYVGPIPPGMQVNHLCETTLCVRPSHLDLRTDSENKRYSMSRKGALVAA